MSTNLQTFDGMVKELRRVGERNIHNNYAYYRTLLHKSAFYCSTGELDTAAVYASIAASHACSHHCGLWSSPELESILRAIGARLPAASKSRPLRRRAEKVYHVATFVSPITGHTRMLVRWINADQHRQHSVVLSKQSTEGVPNFLEEAVANTGGRIYLADTVAGGLIKRAIALRRILVEADIIVLHIHFDDVAPIIALSTNDRPPVIFVDHTDHAFWLGATISDVVANLRDAGIRMSIERRGIDPARVALLPTLINPAARLLSRRAAKERLGLPEDCVLLCSVARAPKYRPLNGYTYADIHLPILQKHPECVLVVVGVGDKQDWSEAYLATGGRLISLPEQPQPKLYFEAADIYIDSFPFVSITSLLEAGSYGTPAVSLFPYGDCCAILGCNMPGLEANLITCRTYEGYQQVLSRIITDEDWRRRQGKSLKVDILEKHTGARWLSALEATYSLAVEMPLNEPDIWLDKANYDEPDVYIQGIFGVDTDPKSRADRMMRFRLGLLPTRVRIRYWWRLLKTGCLRNTSVYGSTVYLLPEWILCRVGRFRKRILHFTARRRAKPAPAIHHSSPLVGTSALLKGSVTVSQQESGISQVGPTYSGRPNRL